MRIFDVFIYVVMPIFVTVILAALGAKAVNSVLPRDWQWKPTYDCERSL